MANEYVGDLQLTLTVPGVWSAEGRSLAAPVAGAIGGGLVVTVLIAAGIGATLGGETGRAWPLMAAGAAVALVIALVLLRATVRQSVAVDQRAGRVHLTRTRLWAARPEGRTERLARPIDRIVLVLRESTLNRQVISIGFDSGERWVWSFRSAASDVDALASLIRSEAQRLRVPAASEVPAQEATPMESDAVEPPPADRATTDALFRRVRSAALWSLGLGALHFVVPNLSPSWGATLILVGGLSLLYPTPAMEIVNVITLLWVAVLNALSGSSVWIGIAVVQLWNGVQSFQRWRALQRQRRDLEGALPVDEREARAGRALPWVGLGLGLGAMLGILAVFVSAIAYAALVGPASESLLFYEIIGFLESLVVNLGVVGFAVSLASLLGGYRPKPVAVVGLICGVAAVAVEFGAAMLFAG